jgi:hypothetical protein
VTVGDPFFGGDAIVASPRAGARLELAHARIDNPQRVYRKATKNAAMSVPATRSDATRVSATVIPPMVTIFEPHGSPRVSTSAPPSSRWICRLRALLRDEDPGGRASEAQLVGHGDEMSEPARPEIYNGHLSLPQQFDDSPWRYSDLRSVDVFARVGLASADHPQPPFNRDVR